MGGGAGDNERDAVDWLEVGLLGRPRERDDLLAERGVLGAKFVGGSGQIGGRRGILEALDERCERAPSSVIGEEDSSLWVSKTGVLLRRTLVQATTDLIIGTARSS